MTMRLLRFVGGTGVQSVVSQEFMERVSPAARSGEAGPVDSGSGERT